MSTPKEVIEELKAVLKKHDLCGLVILTNPKEIQYYIELQATWSCAHLEGPPSPSGGIGVRVRCLRADFPSRAAQRQCLEDTLGTFLGIADCCDDQSAQLRDLVALIIRKTGMTLQHRTRRMPGGASPNDAAKEEEG